MCDHTLNHHFLALTIPERAARLIAVECFRRPTSIHANTAFVEMVIEEMLAAAHEGHAL
jgi:hypothetical protein